MERAPKAACFDSHCSSFSSRYRIACQAARLESASAVCMRATPCFARKLGFGVHKNWGAPHRLADSYDERRARGTDSKEWHDSQLT